jgi:2-polyprenyl-3-methyl-5-hydroxy-6-metoxy-1,4-benzoquinol methylase
MMDRKSHWKKVWTNNPETEVSWFQEKPAMSLELIRQYAGAHQDRILDVGGGSSRLVDGLLEEDFRRVGVMDIAEPALKTAQVRLGDRAKLVKWIEADVLHYTPDHVWDVWHDRAVFHFLTEPSDRALYVQTIAKTLSLSGLMVISTFGPEGPTRCSGLDVMRHSPDSLSSAFGADFELAESRVEMHRTPDNKEQQFVYSVFKRGGVESHGDA